MSPQDTSGAQVTTTPITPMPARLALRILSADDVLCLHAAALELLGAQGAAAEAAALSAPDAVVLGGRVPEHDVTLGAGYCWMATGGPAVRVRPREGGDPRPATVEDLEEACRLADALPEVAVVYGPPVRPVGETALSELARCLAATSKHIQLSTLRTAAEAEAAVRMALAVAGSDDALRERPLLSLCAGTDSLAAAEVFAGAGLPVGAVTPAAAGDAGSRPAASGPAAAAGSAATGPVGLGAALVRHHAGVLAACAAVQAVAPGAPFIYVADPASAGVPAGTAEASMFQIASVQLAAHLRLPVCAGGMATGSHEPDWQACTQNALGSLSTTAAGADLTVGAGVLGAGAAFSAQQLVLDSEIFSWNGRIAAGIAVDDETLALDAIKEVGIGGNFLGQRHTRRHMKDVWRPRLLDRSMWDAWVASGRDGAYEKATELAAELLAAHEVVPLSDEAGIMLLRIVADE